MVQKRPDYIANDLRRRITTGEFAPGAQLPVETVLMEMYEASRPTLRFALAQIENEGLLVRHHGRGNFVRHLTGRLAYGPAGLRSLGPAEPGSPTLTVSVSRRTVEAEDDLAALLGLPPGSTLTEYLYKGRYMTDPCSVARVYVPHAVALLDVPVTSGAPSGEDVKAALGEAGIEVKQTRTRVIARLPCHEESMALRIGTGTPVLAIEETATDPQGRVVALTLAVLPGYNAEADFTDQKPVRELETAC